MTTTQQVPASAAQLLAERLVRLSASGGLMLCEHVAQAPHASAAVRTLGGVVVAAWLPRTTEASCSACAWRATEARDLDDNCDACGAAVERSQGIFLQVGPIMVVASALCDSCMDSPDPDDDAITDAGLVVALALLRLLDPHPETLPPGVNGLPDPRAAARIPDGSGVSGDTTAPYPHEPTEEA